MNTYIVFTDGGSRGNPGNSACGYVIYKCEHTDKLDLKELEAYKNNGTVVVKNGIFLGIKTNNEAEWFSLLYAVSNLKEFVKAEDNIFFLMDSSLVINQISNVWKVKELRLKVFHAEVTSMLSELPSKNIFFQHIYREFNTEADAEVNNCLDAQ